MTHSQQFPYPSQRMPVHARNVVATSQPIATQAGLETLRRGGNAVDAAVATAITLTVVEPTSNGIGGDAFAIVWDGKQLHGFNGSGRSPKSWARARFASRREMPQLGWDSVTVPGAVDAWRQLSERFGKLPFAELFAPAIRYAREGFAVTPITAAAWAVSAERFADCVEFAAAFLPQGAAPRAGEWFGCPAQAATLEEIAATKGASFYGGAIAERIVEHASVNGGAMSLEDLSSHSGEWVETISQEYHGLDVHELPPNGQGIVALIALGILRHLDLRRSPVDSADSVHLQIEAMKVAFAVARRHIADDASMTLSVAEILDKQYFAARAGEIRMDRAAIPPFRMPTDHGTVNLATADADGMMVSFIQSNFMGFGSGVVIPDTGIALQNRGAGFTLERGHPNEVDGGKRPYHTIIPAMVMRDGEPLMSFGVMGGHFQPQGHVQMVTRIFDYGHNPQAASDAPRWQVTEDSRVTFESHFARDVIEELRRRGHVIAENITTQFGGAQIVQRLKDGYCAASDHRKDGCAAGF